MSHTQQQQVEKSYNSNSLRTDGGLFLLLLLLQRERIRENLEPLSFWVSVYIYSSGYGLLARSLQHVRPFDIFTRD